MSRLAVSALATAALFLAASVNAQVYKWKDSHGVMHYSDAPPATGSQYEKVKLNGNVSTTVSTTTAPAAAGTAAAATTTTTKTTTTAPAAPKPDTADNRAKLCKDLNSNIALLNSSSPVTMGSADSAQTNMSDDQRRQQLATAQAQQKQYCSGG